MKRKPKQADPVVTFDPVQIARRSYRPDRMTAEQRASMDHAAAEVLAAYQVFRQSIVAALTAERTHCGSWSVVSMQQAGLIDLSVKSFTNNITATPLKWPELPRLQVVHE